MSIGATIGKYAIKAAGVASAGVLAYDAHCRGKRVAKNYANRKDFEALDYYYENSRNMNSPSRVNANLKDKLFKWELDNNFRHYCNRGTGYMKGFCEMVTNDIVPWGLSIATVCTKGLASKISAGALAAYGVYAFFKNVCGFGIVDK